MHTLLNFIKRNKIETASFLAIILLASFLRLYKIREFVIFLGDEGRDALVVKRMIVDHDLTLLGPTASVGGFYLGPVYYYFMIPAMFASGLDPVGPAIMIALMGIATVALIYLVTRDWFGRFPAIITTFLYAISPGIVRFSRSSWNPNPMPLFSLIAVASLHYSIKKSKNYLAFIAGVAYGITIQLHYLGLIIGPILAVTTFVQAKKKDWIKLAITQILGFLVGASLYFAFEIRHNFPNIRSVIEFVSRGGNTTGPRTFNLPYLFFELNRFNLESVLSSDLASITSFATYVLLVAIFASLYLVTKKKLKVSPPMVTVAIFWLVGIFGIGMYKGQLHYHYFEFLFPVPFLLLAMALSLIKQNKLKMLVGVAVAIASVELLVNQPVWSQGSNLINQTENIADEVIKISQDNPYNFALITRGNSDHAYRFYLETKDYKPTPLKEQVTNQLIVVCEQEPSTCEPLGHPVWEVAGFGRAEIEAKTTVHPNITIFRLIHHEDSLDSIGKPAVQG